MGKKWVKGDDGKFAQNGPEREPKDLPEQTKMFDDKGRVVADVPSEVKTIADVPSIVPASDQKMELANPSEFGFDFRENFSGGATPRLPQITIVSTAQMFKCGEEKFSDFIGTILHYQLCNAWWEKPIEDGSGSPPDCASGNAISPDSGDKKQCETCDKCPMNQYGSDPKDGRGKWCKNMMRLHILRDGDVIPSRLTLSATSLRAADEFFTNLFNKQIAYQIARVGFSLVSAKNKTNIEFSKIQFEVLDVLKTRDEMLNVKSYVDKFAVSFGEKIFADEHVQSVKTAKDGGDGLKY